jgi:zona occludens toxin
MSILISAPIRTGKTLYVIKCIFDELNKGRQVYTNIVGIKIDGVISVSSSIDKPFDWRDLPNGSVLVWDEAHEHPAFAEQDLLKTFRIDETPFHELIDKINSDSTMTIAEKKKKIERVEKAAKNELDRQKESIRDIGRSLLLHGHFGIEIYFITQRPAKLNADVLSSVTTHFVMRRKFGMDAAMIWEFGEAMTTWSKSTAQIALNKRLWRYPKYLYKFYTSSENHQVRKQFPAKYFLFAAVPILLFLFGLNNASETGFFGLFKKEQEKVSQSENTDIITPQNSNIITPQNSKQTNSQPLVCTYNNIHLPECQELQRMQNEAMTKIHYQVADPYTSTSPTYIQLNTENHDFPRLSGCIKYGRKYYGIDQQGNKMPNVSQSACRRWIENSERPFNYFANNQQSNYSEQKNSDTESSKLKIVTDQQDQKNYQYMQNTIN